MGFGYSKGVSRSFLYELKGTDMFFLVGVTTPHGQPKPCPPDKVRTSEQIKNFILFGRHTGRAPITSGTVTGGVQ